MNKQQKLVQEAFLNREESVIKRLKQIYNKSLDDITKKAEELQMQIDMLDSMEGAVTDPEELEVLKSMKQAKVYQKQYQEALKGQVSSVLDNMQTEEFKTVDEYLKTCYEDGFVGTMFDLHGQGIPLCYPMDQVAMVRAVQLDSKISQGLYQRLGEDVAVLKKKIVAQVSRGISSGLTFQQVAKGLSDYTNIGFNNAVRIARTEGHRIQVQSTVDACLKAKDSGADVVKQWDSALDKRTRPSHARVDGEIREMDEPFSNGLMFPGDPSGGAAEVVNCRCALLQRAKWALDDDELKTLKDRAAYFELDKAKNFKDFKAKYLKAAEEIAKAVKPKKTKKTFTPAKTREEAEEFISKYVDDDQFGALGVSYKGVNVEVANEINRTISEFFEVYDVEKFGGITAPAGNTKLGKQIQTAFAGYSPIRNSFILNRNSMKNMKTAMQSFEAESVALKNLLEHPEKYDFSKLSKKAIQTVERSKVSGRATVPKSIEEALNHELGHMLERKVYKSPLWDEALSNMPKYADKISGYAGETTGEYVAESFASYMKGEKVADPVLIEIFESLKR